MNWRKHPLGRAWNRVVCRSRCSMAASPMMLSSCSQGPLQRLCVVVLGCTASTSGMLCTEAAAEKGVFCTAPTPLHAAPGYQTHWAGLSEGSYDNCSGTGPLVLEKGRCKDVLQLASPPVTKPKGQGPSCSEERQR